MGYLGAKGSRAHPNLVCFLFLMAGKLLHVASLVSNSMAASQVIQAVPHVLRKGGYPQMIYLLFLMMGKPHFSCTVQ